MKVNIDGVEIELYPERLNDVQNDILLIDLNKSKGWSIILPGSESH